MIQAYNHFLTEYYSRLPAHSLAHKQKELKEVYSRIVSMSRRTAYYKLDLSKEKQFFSLSLKDSALTMSETLNGLSDVFQKPAEIKRVCSSNPKAVAATLLGKGGTSFTAPVSIRVHQLAKPQVNEGRFVPSKDGGPAPGSYRFHVQTGDEDYEFSYKITNSSSNEDLMKKLVDFINRSNIDIQASFEGDSAGGLSRIVLNSSRTGVPEGETLTFSIFDEPREDGAAGLVSYFGLDQVSQPPSHASFSVNGKEHTNANNQFTLNRNISVSLKQAVDTEITLSPETTEEKLEKAVGEFLKSYNTIVDLTKNSPAGNRRSARLQIELNHIFSTAQETLAAVGLSHGEDHTLSFDPQALLRPETRQQLKAMFEEPDGLLAQLSRKMRDVAINPMEYVDKIIITYPNLSRPGFSNPYCTSLYSGMMFNSYC